MRTTHSSEPLLQIRGLTKAFPGTLALDHVDLTLRAGSVTGLAGHNGSGKSTLVKILAGAHKADAGEIQHASAAGHSVVIHFIHQDLGLIDGLTTVENLGLGVRGPASLLAPRAAQERAEASRLLSQLGVSLDVTTRLSNLTPAQRTMVAFARATAGWTDAHQVLVLDEPTASLQEREAQVVLEMARRIADSGAAVLYISHRLEEITQLSDHLVVLRDGQVTAERERGEFDTQDVAEFIAGRALGSRTRPVSVARTSPVRARLVEVSGLCSDVLDDVTLSVRAGEIVGVSGVMGSGVDELLPTIFGTTRAGAGTVRVDGSPLRRGSARRSIAAGMGFVPRDRHACAAVMGMSAAENLMLPRSGAFRTRRGSIDRRAERAETLRWFGRANISPAQPQRVFAQFSGGNQQKIVISRWMRTVPRVLLLEEPTQGVDVGAQDAIHQLVREAARMGTAVLVASSDTAELVSLCDRVVVMSAGRIVSQLEKSDLDEPTLVRHTLAPRPAPGSPSEITPERGSRP